MRVRLCGVGTRLVKVHWRTCETFARLRVCILANVDNRLYLTCHLLNIQDF